MRAARWVIADSGDGTVDVLRNGRLLRSDLPISVAQRYVSRKRSGMDKVFLQEPDGYRKAI